MNEMNASNTASQPAKANPYVTGFDRKMWYDGDAASHPIKMQVAAASACVAAGTAAMYANCQSQVTHGCYFGSPPQLSQQAQADNFDYNSNFDKAMANYDLTSMTTQKRSARRGLMIAVTVGTVAILGSIGAWVLSYDGGDGAGAPVFVKADKSPIKVKPKNLGGTVVPNQNSLFYDRVAGDRNGIPKQHKLVTNSEEPIDVLAQDTEYSASNMLLDTEEVADYPTVTVKSEEHIKTVEQPDVNTKTAAAVPRKVRTMLVKPDGTLVAR